MIIFIVRLFLIWILNCLSKECIIPMQNVFLLLNVISFKFFYMNIFNLFSTFTWNYNIILIASLGLWS